MSFFQTLMNVRTQASTVVARTPSAQTAHEATFAHAHQDMNRQTKPMEKISHVKVSWLRPYLRDYRFIAPISIFNRTGQCYNLSADLFPYDEAWSQWKSIWFKMCVEMPQIFISRAPFWSPHSFSKMSLFTGIKLSYKLVLTLIMSWVLGNC